MTLQRFTNLKAHKDSCPRHSFSRDLALTNTIVSLHRKVASFGQLPTEPKEVYFRVSALSHACIPAKIPQLALLRNILSAMSLLIKYSNKASLILIRYLLPADSHMLCGISKHKR